MNPHFEAHLLLDWSNNVDLGMMLHFKSGSTYKYFEEIVVKANKKNLIFQYFTACMLYVLICNLYVNETTFFTMLEKHSIHGLTYPQPVPLPNSQT